MGGDRPNHIIGVAGMHRSGTSLIGSFLHHCSIDLGNAMVKPGKGNLRGHFEDREIVSFHQSVLHSIGSAWIKSNFLSTFNPSLKIELNVQQQQWIRKLASDRITKDSSWGFKDPRLSLFLFDWKKIIPEIKYIFVYRHPLLVIDSLFRRSGSKLLYLYALRAGACWLRYNQEILKFYKHSPNSCVMINISGFNLNPEPAIELLSRKFQMYLNAEYSDIYKPDELSMQHSDIGFFTKMNQYFLGKQLMEQYQEMETLSLVNEIGDIQGAC